MRTISFTYDARNVKARRMVEEMRNSGLFIEQPVDLQSGMNEPNEATFNAIQESRSGKYAGTVDVSSLDAFKKSLGL
ncbi:MAG: toxin-antitoxin system protein [Bacteroidaceae bacterium]|nr:toxin-antitoxin system protein [Bacteroidaceae bacterium]